MKCTTCQQTDFKTIHGRVFCAGCGSDAARRLRSFSPTIQPSSDIAKIGAERVLDLSQPNIDTKNVESISLPKPQPDIHQPLQKTQAPSQNHSQPSLGGLSQLQQNQPAQMTPPGIEDNSPAEGTLNSSTTVMQPHQTYRLKDEPNPVAMNPADSSDLPELNTLTTDSEPPVTRPKRKKGWSNLFASRIWRGAVVAMSMVLLAGYITYLNYPNIAVKVAANKADINAHLPGYLPSGYDFDGPIAYGAGQITINFQADADNRITLSQSNTSWDSSSLLENYVKYQTASYDTYHENGLTIYTYDNRYAAWVNSGMMYMIESSDPLNVDDIVKMASSL